MVASPLDMSKGDLSIVFSRQWFIPRLSLARSSSPRTSQIIVHNSYRRSNNPSGAAGGDRRDSCSAALIY